MSEERSNGTGQGHELARRMTCAASWLDYIIDNGQLKTETRENETGTGSKE